MKQNIEISTIEQASELLTELLSGASDKTIDPADFVFSHELQRFCLTIVGEKFDGSITGSLAKGIWEFQQEIYRAAAFSVTGIDDIRKISSSLDSYTLIFKLEKGSLIIEASLKDVVEACKEGFKTMDSKHKAIVLVVIVLTIGTGWSIDSLIDSKTQIELDKQKTSQMALIAEAAKNSLEAERWANAATNGARSIVKSAPEADSITIGGITIQKDQIQEINSRAVRGRPETTEVSGKFRIIGFKRQSEGISRFTLGSPDGEIPVVLDVDSFDKEQLEKFWSAAQHDFLIQLELQTTTVNGTVTRAWVSDIPTNKPS